MDVQGLAAIITGGGSGLGAETARHLAKAGAKVTVPDLNPETVEAVAAETGGLGIACDVGSAEELEAAVAKAREAHGPCRIAVNCAGIAPAKRIVGRGGAMRQRTAAVCSQASAFTAASILSASASAAAPVLPSGRDSLVTAMATSGMAMITTTMASATFIQVFIDAPWGRRRARAAPTACRRVSVDAMELASPP